MDYYQDTPDARTKMTRRRQLTGQLWKLTDDELPETFRLALTASPTHAETGQAARAVGNLIDALDRALALARELAEIDAPTSAALESWQRWLAEHGAHHPDDEARHIAYVRFRDAELQAQHEQRNPIN
ncbi:hypothetical protein ACFVVM_32935 [Nocardia sp. NPDC058176]|uniref:hypothetical protein n=1 Tax=Nocardia sp. NPDC058176 TaxID=3346368 RepID=UPI0036DE6196